MTLPLRDRPTARYRFYDSDGSSIYIGIAVDIAQRWAFHKATARWWALIDSSRTIVDWYPNRSEAEAAEIEAIAAERPAFNIAHTDRSARSAPGPSRWAQARAEGLHVPTRKRMLMATQAVRAQLKSVLDAVTTHGAQVIVVSRSRPTAVLVPIDWYREAAEKMGDPTEY